MNFSHERFDANKYVEEQLQMMDERGVRRLVGELGEFRRVSADEMRKSVYANYSAFIRTSKEISELEVQLQQMKNLLTVQTNFFRSLMAADSILPTASATSAGGGFSPKGSPLHMSLRGGKGGVTEEDDDRLWAEEEEGQSEIEKYADALPDILDILIAERKVERAMELLEQGHQIVQLALNPPGGEEQILPLPAAHSLRSAILERRAWLVSQLEEAAQAATVRGQELRVCIAALHRLGETERAHQLLLSSYGAKIRSGARALRPGGTSYGGAYTAALAQVVFSAISQAASDSSTIFASEPACAAELFLWSQRETEFCVSLLKRNVLSSAAAAGGLHAAAECVRIALGHCSLLEERGLALAPALSRQVRPSVEEALEFNIIRIEDSVATMAAVDNWSLHPLPSVAPSRLRAINQSLGPGPHNLRLSSSAQRFYLLLVDLVEDILPVISLQLYGRLLDRLASLFEAYAGMLHKALPVPAAGEDDPAGCQREKMLDGGGASGWTGGSVRTAADEQQQLALLGNAAALADDLLPRLAQRLTMAANEEGGDGDEKGGSEAVRRQAVGRNQAEQKEWKRRLQKAVDKLRDVLCSCLVADFMYGDDGRSVLTPEEYLQMDDRMRLSQWKLNPMPTPPFQALYMALTGIQSTANYVLGGRERVVTLLLMRLAEWLMMGLMVYSTFWDDLQASEYCLGPTALQQLVFDMYFVMQVAKHGKFSSRAMRKVAEDSATKAIVLFTEQTGGDPNTLLEEDWWYEQKCLEVIEALAEAANEADEQGDEQADDQEEVDDE